MQKLKCSDCDSEELVFKREQRISYEDYLIYECDDCGEEFSVEKERKHHFSDMPQEEFDRMVKFARRQENDYQRKKPRPHSNRDKIVEMYLNNPNITTTEVGRKFGITKQRVCQILGKHGIYPNARRVARYKAMRVCPECGGAKNPAPKVCPECSHSFHFDNFICEICGVDFDVRKTETRRRVKLGRNLPRFHNNNCRRIWLSRGRPAKDEYDPIADYAIQSGEEFDD